MLTTFRNHAKGWIAWVFVVLVSVPFIFWGIGQYRSLVISNYVAKVNGYKVMPNAFQNAYGQAYEEATSNGQTLNPAQEKKLKNQVLKQLIQSALLREKAGAYHLVASTNAVRSYISQMPAFQFNGSFNINQYKEVLARNGLDPDQFEAEVRGQLGVQQLEGGLLASEFVTKNEMNSLISLLNQKRKVQWIVVSPKRYRVQAPTDAEIKRYYAAHKKRYMNPETVAIKYIQLDKKGLEGRVKATPAKLRSFYESHLTDYGIPPARKAAEILIRPKSDKPGQWKAAKAKLQKILATYRGHKDHPEKAFSELARQYSDAKLAKRNGGAVGWISQGQGNRQFVDALFALKKTYQVSAPIRTNQGWVAVQLLDRRGGKVKPYKEVRQQVKTAYLAHEAQKLYYKLGDQLANLAYENSGSLSAVSKKLQLPVRELTGISRKQGKGIASHKAIRHAAFSAQVLKRGQNSNPIKLGEENAVVLRTTKVTPSQVKPLAEVRKEIVATLLHQMRSTRMKAAVQSITSRVNKGTSLNDVAKRMHLKINGPELLTRHSSKVPSQLISAVFSMGPPTDASRKVGNALLANGDSAIFVLTKVIPGHLTAVKKSEVNLYEQQLQQIFADSMTASYSQWLRQHASVKVIRKNIP